jgi:hypothetical protein
MDPLDTLLAAADGGRRVGGQWLVRCPAHDDRKPSLAVRERDDGVLLLRCHAGCATEDILDALNLEFADLYPERP